MWPWKLEKVLPCGTNVHFQVPLSQKLRKKHSLRLKILKIWGKVTQSTNFEPSICLHSENMSLQKCKKSVTRRTTAKVGGFDKSLEGHILKTICSTRLKFSGCSFYFYMNISKEFHQNLRGSLDHPWESWHGMTHQPSLLIIDLHILSPTLCYTQWMPWINYGLPLTIQVQILPSMDSQMMIYM